MHVRPDTKYGAPPPPTSGEGSPRPPSPTYGVPGHEPGSPSTKSSGTYPNGFDYERPPSPPSPTYGVPKNSYIPPANSEKNFQVNTAVFVPVSAAKGASGYVYDRPSENLQSAKMRARTDASTGDSKSSESDEKVNNVHLTTTSPRAEPEFFFSEQFERLATTTQAPTTQAQLITSSQLVLEQHQQPVFHPQEQPFFPNSPPAPFSTAAYREQGQGTRRDSLEPLPTLATRPQPPDVNAKDFFRYSDPVTDYNQSDWFKRISRAANHSDVSISESAEELDSEPQRQPAMTMNATFIREMREKQETLRLLFPAISRDDVEEDLIIDFNAARALGGNRTSRRKRQDLTTHSVCDTTSQYIEPQTALSRDGEWKFIVNQVESARQLVKVEYCA